MKVLIVAAHPDDEVLGCGGTIAKLSGRHDVAVAFLGEGVTSRYSRPEQAPRAALEKLHADARTVAKMLGIRSITFHNLPDNRFDEIPLLDIVKHLEGLIETLRPEVVYTHHPGDLNVDHTVSFRAVLTATRPTKACPVREIYCFEAASSTEWSFQRIASPFRPSVFVDIAETLKTKIEALKVYDGEIRDSPHPRSADALHARCRYWGSMVGLEYAEPFELIRSIRP